FEVALAEGERTGSFDLARQLSLVTGESRQVLAVARAWAKSGAYQDAVQWAEGRLDERDRLNLARYVRQIVRQDGRVLDALFGDPRGALARFLDRLEALTGEPVFPASRLYSELRSRVLNKSSEAAPPAFSYVAAHIPAEDMVDFMQEYH